MSQNNENFNNTAEKTSNLANQRNMETFFQKPYTSIYKPLRGFFLCLYWKNKNLNLHVFRSQMVYMSLFFVRKQAFLSFNQVLPSSNRMILMIYPLYVILLLYFCQITSLTIAKKVLQPFHTFTCAGLCV